MRTRLDTPGAGQVSSSGYVDRLRDGTAVSVSERLTEDGTRYAVRETVSYPSGRKEVREYTRPADVQRTTLLGEQPEAILPVVAIAIAVAAAPLLVNRTPLRRPARAVAAALLFAGALIGGLSVGLLYAPSAAAMAVAAVRA